MRAASASTSSQEIVISRDRRAARRSDLHECEFPLILGPFLEESFDSAESFDDSLGVVDAINTHAEKAGLDSKILEQ